MKILAEILSWVFLPLLTPVYGLLIAMYVISQPFPVDAHESLYLLPDKLAFDLFA